MNTDRKINLLERKIERLEETIDKLKTENNALIIKNQQLENIKNIYDEGVSDTLLLQEECNKCIDEAIAYKNKYKEAYLEILKIKNEYSSNVKKLNKKFKI